jgi:hypothetical protein
MTAIANVALSNTFDYWRIRTNEAINFINTEAANTGWAVSNTGFQSALANTNLAISDRLQVANASVTYTTIATFNSALANTNAYIATKVNTSTFNSALANTNAYIATKVNTSTFNSALANTNLAVADRLQVANATSQFASTGKAIAMAIVFG